MSETKYRVIGLMSGTSLDGVDIAFVELKISKTWSFSLGPCETITYSNYWSDLLQNLHKKEPLFIKQIDLEYGKYLAEITHQFIHKNKLSVDLISSHGHTIFHEPKKGLTKQIGDGHIIAQKLKKNVVCDFRSLDVSLGGQGAPLVPIGDELLFSEYNYCLNLGGFSNISYQHNNERLAYDICPVNIVLNKLANRFGVAYDNEGKISKSGSVNNSLLYQLNALPYYSKSHPKSLGNEWVNKFIWPIIDPLNETTENLMRTFTEHIAMQIGEKLKKGKCLTTGGGCHNLFLMERIQFFSNSKLIKPEDDIVNFKEALIFALLGVLKQREEINTLKSVTGSKRDSSGGTLICY